MTKGEKIRQELESCRLEGIIHAERVVEWARNNPDSELHGEFEWDDGKAAHEYRIWQARRVIAVNVVSEHGERQVISLSIDRIKGGGYRNVEDVARDPSLMEIAVKDALTELRRVRAKYQHLKQLSDVWGAIGRHDEAPLAGAGQDEAREARRGRQGAA